MKSKPAGISHWFNQLRLWPARARGRRRLNRTVIERINGLSFVVTPGVFNPTTFRSGKALAEYIASVPDVVAHGAGATALDVGTGCGIQAIVAATRGFRVTGIDINPLAVRCARINALLHEAEDEIEILQGDLFAPVEGRSFDLITFNPPFFDGVPENSFGVAWRSVDTVERFAAGLPQMLAKSGCALIIWSSHARNERLSNALSRTGLDVDEAHTIQAVGERMIIYRVRHRN